MNINSIVSLYKFSGKERAKTDRPQKSRRLLLAGGGWIMRMSGKNAYRSTYFKTNSTARIYMTGLMVLRRSAPPNRLMTT